MNERTSGEVRFELDPDNPPTMSDEQIAALRSMTDEDIDLSDAPARTDQPTRRILRSNLDLDSPQRLQQDDLDLLSNIREMPDEQIDFSDLPPAAQETVWSRPGRGIGCRVTLDADVLAFFRESGEHYQSRVNAALREYMAAHRKSA